jgi:type-F conjugative transfer system secretin TraK
MITKHKLSLSFLFFLFFSTTIVSTVFAEETNKNNKIDTPQGTAQNNNTSDKHGTSGVDAGAAAKSAASANITISQDIVNKTENGEQTIKSIKKTTGDYANVKEIQFADNEQIRIALSNRDINRVFVTGDKIKTIQGPTGLYTAKNDSFDASGSAYISIYGETSFTMFMSTVKSHNFSLLVIPKTAPGRTVVLEPTTPTLLANTRAEVDDYQKTLIDLISNMINLEPSEDYEYFSISEAKKHKWIKNAKEIKKTNFYNVADITPVAFYRGEKLSGILSKIRNRTRNPLVLKPSYFYQSEVKAVALSLQTIPPLESCWLYQIVGQD